MYMPEQPAHSLSTVDGEKIALQSTAVEVIFNNLLCETSMSQVYRNFENSPIEAVYTFPLSSQAVLLGLDVTIGGRDLTGVVIEKASAEEQYEEAITSGNAAIMLEQVQPGLYTMNVGNILAGEEIRVTSRYAELYVWQGGSLRFHLPTTIAPRYGNPEQAGLQPHQTPEYSLSVEHRFQLKLTLAGILAQAGIKCPSHQIAVADSVKAKVVTLATGRTFMDRDFVLNISLPETEQDAVHINRDHDGGFVALASFSPKLPAPDEIPPKSVKIVVDCSGSMAGDSIAQARQAISDILSQLRPVDYFNIIAFGSLYKTFFSRQVHANKDNITKVRRILRTLDADMGGTEMQPALQATVHLPGPQILHDVLLITDGEIWESDELVGMMKQSGHRVFTVGVGSSVSEGFIRQLAHETGGACELVVPNEEMTAKIVRHFKRIFLPRAEKVMVRWPQKPLQVLPKDLGPVYNEDTLHVFARFSQEPRGPVTLVMSLADGRTLSQTVDLKQETHPVPGNAASCPGPLARMAICRSLGEQNKAEAIALAVRYQLISPYTNYLIVDARSDGEKSEDLPKLRKVPQMSAAGWSGTGTLLRESAISSSDQYFSDEVYAPAPPQVLYSIAASPEDEHRRQQQTTPEYFISNCNHLHTTWLNPVLRIKSFQDLQHCQLPDRIATAVKLIADQIDRQTKEEISVLAFLVALLQSPAGAGFDRNTRRAINKKKKVLEPDERLLNLMTEAFAGLSRDDWGSDYPLVDKLEDIGDDQH